MDETAAAEELTTNEAAVLAGVSPRSIRAWLAAGHVQAVARLDGRRVTRSSLLAYLAARGATSAALPSATSATVPGLPEVAAIMEAQRKELRDLRWQNGYLQAQLDAEKRKVAGLIETQEQILLLAAGAEAAAAPESETPEAEAVAEDAPPWWARLRRWWDRGGI